MRVFLFNIVAILRGKYVVSSPHKEEVYVVCPVETENPVFFLIVLSFL